MDYEKAIKIGDSSSKGHEAQEWTAADSCFCGSSRLLWFRPRGRLQFVIGVVNGVIW